MVIADDVMERPRHGYLEQALAFLVGYVGAVGHDVKAYLRSVKRGSRIESGLCPTNERFLHHVSPTIPGRSTSCFHRRGRDLKHQA